MLTILYASKVALNIYEESINDPSDREVDEENLSKI